MKLNELKTEIQKYQYFEDTSIIDVSLASVIANRLKLGDPVWLIIIGASSGGKSQILRPLAMTDEKFIHRVDDLTENTFLSGAKVKGDEPVSLLLRIGNQGIIVISDFTVLMSKSTESRATILSQLRMLYDGEMTKYSGNSPKPIKWPASGTGYLGMLAGSTPSIYAHFEDVADMGERFIYYRMKEADPLKATRLALSRTVYGRELDKIMSDMYGDYIKEVVKSIDPAKIELPENVKERIIEVSMFAERVRTTAHKEWRGELIDKIPVPAMPMRVALQLTSVVKGLGAIKLYETGSCDFNDEDMGTIDWMAYSLANEEKRAVLKVVASVAFDTKVTTSSIADMVGLDTKIVRVILQNLASVGVLDRMGDDGSLTWGFKTESDYNIVRRIEHIKGITELESRGITAEEEQEAPTEADIFFDSIGNNDRPH